MNLSRCIELRANLISKELRIKSVNLISILNCKSILIESYHDDSFLKTSLSHPRCQPGTVAGACKPSRWAVTLMDVLTLGSLVDGRNERNSGRYKPGKVLPARGRDLELYCEQPTPLSCHFHVHFHLSGGRGFDSRRRQKLSALIS